MTTEGSLFDARRALLSEGEDSMPGARWRTVSLVTAIRGLVRWSPAEPLAWPSHVANPAASLEAFGAATDELTRRGLDADSLVRYGMRNEITGVLAGMLVVSDLGLGADDLAMQRGADLDAWRKVLGPLPGVKPSTEEVSARRLHAVSAAAVAAYVPPILGWVATAPLNDLMTLSPPSEIRQGRQVPASSDPKVCQRYAWLVDRFATTSARDWLTGSLQYEYRWINDLEPPPCPPMLMGDREVDLNALSAELARRSALSIGGEPDPESMLASEIDRHARVLLRAKRYREAAALFEFASLRRPLDADVRNNLGFCLVPENPAQALDALRAAAHMGYAPAAVNVHNQACCHLILGQPRSAVGVAEEYWKVISQAGGAMLWHWDPSQPVKLMDVDDANVAIAELMARLSAVQGWREEESRWLERTRQLEAA
jgi:hypothetical protein